MTKNKLAMDVMQEFAQWEGLIQRTTISGLEKSGDYGSQSVKDTLFHLKTWQEITLARLQAALRHEDPVWHGWPSDLDPESEEDLDTINTWIMERGSAISFNRAHRDWANSYKQMLSLLEAIRESDLFESGKYVWLPGYSLADVVIASVEHHREHREQLEKK